MTRGHFVVSLVFLIFFVISLLTNILGPLIPDIITGFRLSLGMAGFLPFAFFVAYGVMSIPSGMLVDRFREKPVIAGAFAVAFAGSLGFAMFPVFGVALVSLFLIGIGMAMLQVAINPLLRVAGGAEHFAFNSVVGQLVFGLASFISPWIYSTLILRLGDPGGEPSGLLGLLGRLVPDDLPWVSLYWVFTGVTAVMLAVVGLAPLPRVERTDEERAGAWATHAALLAEPHVLLYALGIFCYVGTEQGIANWISQFLQSHHGFDPQTTGARAVSYFWGLMTAGCLLGLLVLKLLDSRTVLIGAAAAAMLTLGAALSGSAQVALVAFPLAGFWLSVMWSIIVSLGLNSIPRHHGSMSGILCTGIVGGAVVPLVVGWLGDAFGLRQGLLFLYLPLLYILAIGFWARPLVTNARMGQRGS